MYADRAFEYNVAMTRKTSPPAARDDRSARQKAYGFLQRKIASREYAAGSALSELSVAKQLGISRTPVREAIGQLVAEGLLEQIPNRGVVIAQLTRNDIVDLYELREALEVYAIGKAARRSLDPADLHRLQNLADEIVVLRDELVHAGKAELDPEQMHRFVVCDLGFHTLLMRLAANGRILKVVNETRLLIRIFAIRRTGHNLADLERIYAQHCDLLRAVSERDPERAMRLLSEHIQNSQRERLAEHDHWDREDSLRSSLPVYIAVPGKS
jgi:DNA-binding GntR family transcriptional regulator